MKRSITLALVTFLIAALAGACIPQGVEAQAENRVLIRTDYEMLGFGSLHGGGHLTYELYGQAAGDLRRAVLATYDGSISGVNNSLIDPEELKMNEQTGYIAAIETLLANTQFFAGSTNRFEPLHEGQGELVTADAQGFVEVQNIVSDDSTPVRIYLYFDATSDYTGDFTLLGPEFIRGLFNPVIGTNLIHMAQYQFQYKHTDYRISMSSIYSPDLSEGSMFLARTPAGEVTTFNVYFSYDGVNIPTTEVASYSPFHFLENPQVLFIMVFICCYLISYVPTKMYVNYKYAYPRKFRHRAKKVLWLHIGNKLLILLLLLFYFFPTMFAFISRNFFINGIAMWILSIILTVGIGAGAKIIYDKKTAEIPQEYAVPTTVKVHKRAPAPAKRPVATTTTPAGVNIIVQETPKASAKESGPPCAVCYKPITDFSDLTKCKCGQLYHEKCAEVIRNCKKCSKSLVDLPPPVAAAPPPPPAAPRTKSVQCPTCGEINKVAIDAELMREKCISCKTILEDVKPGYNYLVVDSEPNVAYSMFTSILKKGYSGLVISTTFPEKLKKEYNMSQCEIIWLTDTSVPNQKTLNPHRLEFEMMRMYSAFVKSNQKSAVMLDGFEYLVVENGFDKVYKFIKKVNDLSSVHQATLMVPIGPSSLEPDQLGTLKKEFDEVVDITDDDD
jgi:hypothetical protein